MEQKYLFTIEVVKESRAIVEVVATSAEDAYKLVDQQVASESIEWVRKDEVSSNIITTKKA